MIITNEMKRAVELAGIEPVPLEDPENGSTYFLIRADVYERLRGLVRVKPPGPSDEFGEFHDDKSLYEFGEFRPYK